MSSEIKRGAVVVLNLGGKVYNALVLALCATEVSHLGENDEPALHLAYLPDEQIVNGKPKVQPIGYIPAPETIYGVVHASHEFSRDYLRDHGLRKLADDDPQKIQAETEIRIRRGAGEWMTVSDYEDLLWERERQKVRDEADAIQAQGGDLGRGATLTSTTTPTPGGPTGTSPDSGGSAKPEGEV